MISSENVILLALYNVRVSDKIIIYEKMHMEDNMDAYKDVLAIIPGDTAAWW